MQTNLADFIKDTAVGREADAILRSCVHCGFCTATCPTYQLLGDELDGPRGRIYLIKQMLEGQPVTEKTQLHLDRCLSCRACETTCPSGVKYHRLLEIGRQGRARERQQAVRKLQPAVWSGLAVTHGDVRLRAPASTRPRARARSRAIPTSASRPSVPKDRKKLSGASPSTMKSARSTRRTRPRD